MDFIQNFLRILMPFASTFPVGILSEKKLAAEFFGAVHTAEVYYREGYAITCLYKIHIYMP